MVIYKITNKINGKMYIGQTVSTIASRWSQHCRSKRCRLVSRAIQKYGKEKFEIKVLSHCNSIEEMNHREQYYIKLFDTLVPNGYNLTTGGKNSKHTEETKNKISESRIGSNNPMYGKEHSKEHKEKISKSLKGFRRDQEFKNKMHDVRLNNPNFEKINNKISKSKKGKKHHFFNKQLSAQHKENISIAHKKRGPNCMDAAIEKRRKPVICLNNNKIYCSVTEACKDLNIKLSYVVYGVLKGRFKQVNGFILKYLENK